MAQEAGWEVEGFIARLTRRDDTNSERLVLEAVSHLRAFSRDCDALRESNTELRAEIEQLRAALKPLVESHNYRHLDMGIGTATPEGRMWLNARTALNGNEQSTNSEKER